MHTQSAGVVVQYSRSACIRLSSVPAPCTAMNKPAARSTSPLETFTPDLLGFCHARTLIKVLMKKKYLCMHYHEYTLTIYIGVMVRETNDFFLQEEQLFLYSAPYSYSFSLLHVFK